MCPLLSLPLDKGQQSTDTQTHCAAAPRCCRTCSLSCAHWDFPGSSREFSSGQLKPAEFYFLGPACLRHSVRPETLLGKVPLCWGSCLLGGQPADCEIATVLKIVAWEYHWSSEAWEGAAISSVLRNLHMAWPLLN